MFFDTFYLSQIFKASAYIGIMSLTLACLGCGKDNSSTTSQLSALNTPNFLLILSQNTALSQNTNKSTYYFKVCSHDNNRENPRGFLCNNAFQSITQEPSSDPAPHKDENKHATKKEGGALLTFDKIPFSDMSLQAKLALSKYSVQERFLTPLALAEGAVYGGGALTSMYLLEWFYKPLQHIPNHQLKAAILATAAIIGGLGYNLARNKRHNQNRQTLERAAENIQNETEQNHILALKNATFLSTSEHTIEAILSPKWHRTHQSLTSLLPQLAQFLVLAGVVAQDDITHYCLPTRNHSEKSVECRPITFF